MPSSVTLYGGKAEMSPGLKQFLAEGTTGYDFISYQNKIYGVPSVMPVLVSLRSSD